MHGAVKKSDFRGFRKHDKPEEKQMTEKELHRLRRQDLLQLLVTQTKEGTQQQEDIEKLQSRTAELEATYERLKNRLDEKDAQIERLKEKLNDKDALIEKLKGRLDKKDADIRILREGGMIELDEEDGTTRLVTMRIEELFNVARAAAEEYFHSKQDALETAEEPVKPEEPEEPAESEEPAEPEMTGEPEEEHKETDNGQEACTAEEEITEYGK